MFKARVVAVHPEDNSVDLISMHDGRRFPGVHVLSGMAGTNVGLVDLPEPSVTDINNPYSSDNTGVRDMYAVAEFIDGTPVVLGFVLPQVSQCNFAFKNTRIYRHASDVYSTIDGSGNIEIAHPSGTFIRIAEVLTHVDLTETDADKVWKIANNTTKLPGIRVQIAGTNGVKATLSIDASGNVTLTNAGNISVTAQGTMSLSSVGNAMLHSDGDVTISAGGDVAVTGTRIDLN